MALDNPFIQDNIFELVFAYSSDEIKIVEETLMIGTSSHIGSVGGSLGQKKIIRYLEQIWCYRRVLECLSM